MRSKHYIWLKLAALTAGIMLLMLVVIGGAIIHTKNVMMEERQEQIKSVVDSALSIATHYHRESELGLITVEAAKEKTKEVTRAIRYGDNGYLFIFDTKGAMEAHAFYPELEGRDRIELKDAKGVPYVAKQIEKALSGGGYTFYHFKKPNQGTEAHPKMIYNKLFKPWGWVFVTGIYIDDLDVAFNDQLTSWSKLVIPLFVFLILLTILLTRAIVRPFNQLEDAIERASLATKAKTDFLANMSHEIRTPLNGAMGMMALLLGTHMTVQQKEWAQISYRSCEDLLNLINDILDISKVEAEQMVLENVPFELQTTVRSITDILYPRAQSRGVELIVAFQSDLPRFFIGDPVRIRQLIMNLVNNAVKFTEDGYILISVEGHKVKDQYELKVEVKDTGIGIPADKQAYIFEKFSQAEESTTRDYGGTGLGLAICRKLTAMMDGEVGVRSKEGEGSTFWFTATLGYEPSPEAVASLSPHDKGEKILIDYKHELVRKALTGHIRGWSYNSAESQQGGGTLAMLQQDVALGQPYDFVVVDVSPDYPDTEALENYIKTIHRASPHTQLILVVAPDSLYNYEVIDLEHSVGILTKPIFPQELFDLISELVERRRKSRTPEFVRLRDDKGRVTIPPDEEEGHVERWVLVAEDQKVNQMLMRTVLNQYGYKTDVASNGVEAVRLAAERQYDIIFMDGHMPEMDGLEATKQIREFEVRLKRHTPIVALTADAMKGDRDKCLAAGMDDYLHKPVKAIQIKDMVEKYVNRSKAES